MSAKSTYESLRKVFCGYDHIKKVTEFDDMDIFHRMPGILIFLDE